MIIKATIKLNDHCTLLIKDNNYQHIGSGKFYLVVIIVNETLCNFYVKFNLSLL